MKRILIADVLSAGALLLLYVLEIELGLVFNFLFLNNYMLFFAGRTAVIIMSLVLCWKWIGRLDKTLRITLRPILIVASAFALFISTFTYLFLHYDTEYDAVWENKTMLVFERSQFYTTEMLVAYQQINPLFMKELGDIPCEHASHTLSVKDGSAVFSIKYDSGSEEIIEYKLYK